MYMWRDAAAVREVAVDEASQSAQSAEGKHRQDVLKRLSLGLWQEEQRRRHKHSGDAAEEQECSARSKD